MYTMHMIWILCFCLPWCSLSFSSPPSLPPFLPSQRLLKYTSEDHPDRRPLEAAEEAMRQLATHIDEIIGQLEKIEGIKEWQETIGGWKVCVCMCEWVEWELNECVFVSTPFLSLLAGSGHWRDQHGNDSLWRTTINLKKISTKTFLSLWQPTHLLQEGTYNIIYMYV